MEQAVAKFIEFYEALGAQPSVDLEPVYDEQIEFIDPVHRMQGLPALNAYFDGLLQNVGALTFRITETSTTGNQAFLQWVMSYSHPRLAAGKTINVHGISHIRFDDKVTYHRDYYDLGEMLYEHLPVYGWVTRKLRARLAA